MTQNLSSKEQEIDEAKVEGEEPDIEVKVEGDEPKQEVKEEKKEDEPDVEALRKQLTDLKSAQEIQKSQAAEADRRAKEAAAQLAELWKTNQQSQIDSIATAMGAAQIEIDAAKKDIVLAGAAQDYNALADAQERLATAKAHMVNLEHGRDVFESQQQQPRQQEDPIEANPNLYREEKNWLRQHPEAMSDPRKNAKLNAAYFDAMDKGLSRGSREYFDFIEEQMGYREKKPEQVQNKQEESIVYAAPPSKTVPSGSGAGGSKKVYTLTKEEAEIAKLSGITPQEYVKQKLILQDQKRVRPDDFPER